MISDLLAIPPTRISRLGEIRDRLLGARRVALTTHVNADGDGSGSEAAIAAWLELHGVQAHIVNPTPYPDPFRFLLHRPDLAVDLRDGGGKLVGEADVLLVLDTSEPNRIAPLLEHVDRTRTIVVDHHPAGPNAVGDLRIQDPSAAATAELVYDILTLGDTRWPEASTLGMYVAMVSDTGSFRFSNTTPRAHAIAADLLHRGVDPEYVFQQLYGAHPMRRFELLREALAGMEHEDGITWMYVPDEVAGRLGVTNEDFEGLIDHARSVEGTRVAILFRGTPEGTTKVSLRSNGTADVNRVARAFDGGGHVKAAGAVMDVAPEKAIAQVLEKAREQL